METKVLYLATTFPRFSETFLQREVNFLLEQPEISLDIRSLWGGTGIFKSSKGDLQIPTSTIKSLPSALSKLPYWILKCPQPVRTTLGFLLNRPPPMSTNWLENNWGFAWALEHAKSINESPNRPDLIHATWGTMPAAVAYTLHQFTGIPYTMEAHAYDVYQNGGDWFLREKAKLAKFVRSSTKATRKDLIERHQPESPEKYCLIRRGISLPEKPAALRHLQKPIRLISVGRLVDKKNLHFQLKIFRELVNRNIPFSAQIIGSGPLLEKLQKETKRLDLGSRVIFRGRQDYKHVEEAYRNADALLFTGKPTRNGDRDGLPNVIAEAMSMGVLVLTTPVKGAMEAIEHGKTGLVLPFEDFRVWAQTLQSLPQLLELDKIRANALKWVYENFSIDQNGSELKRWLLEAAKDRQAR
jgi:colanic acid/amylovoran biosynthesis glycosyltransferase